MSPQRTGIAAACLALSAGLWWLTAGLQPAWWAAWLAPLPLLAWSLRVQARTAALGTVAAFGAGGCVLWPYLHDVIRLPLPVVLWAILVPALLLVPAVLLFRALVLRGRPGTAAFGFAFATTGLSWLAARTSPHGTYGHLAYSQMDALPIVQIAALAGLWGVGCLVCLPAAAAAACTTGAGPRQARWRAGIAATLVVALALVYGLWRLHVDADGEIVRVGLASIGGDDAAQADLDRPAGRRLLARYLATFERLADDGAQVIVGPESALLVRDRAIPSLQALADRRGVRLLIGAEDHSEPTRKRNSALVFQPRGTTPLAYFKHHLIPGFEARYTPGDHRTLLDGAPRTAVAICKDLDFTDTGLANARLGARLLLVPAWDFDIDAWMHARMAIMRGVEGGFAMARVARDGTLTLSDDRGRVLAEASAVDRDGATRLVGDLPVRATRTLYARCGDAFGWLSLLAALCLAGVACLRVPRAEA